MPRVARERKEGRKNLILSSQQSPAELAAWHPFQPRARGDLKTGTWSSCPLRAVVNERHISPRWAVK